MLIQQTNRMPEQQIADLSIIWDMARATALILIFRQANSDPALTAITTRPTNDQITRAETAAWRYLQRRNPGLITPESTEWIMNAWEEGCDPSEIIYPNDVRDEIIQSILNDVDNRRSTVAPQPAPQPAPMPAVIIIDPQLPPQPALWLQPRLQF
ncbi:MAG: hypothetical protein M3Y56_09635 [Armatimonadota bacterium]|nr:hypothetical protein [Armatimonadota bacterium]